jgi:positive regulator of sigma E activity
MVGGVFLAFILWISLRLFRLDVLMLLSTVALFTFFSYLVFQENIISVELGFILTTLGFIFMTTYQKMILKDMTPEIVVSYVVILVAILFIILR